MDDKNPAVATAPTAAGVVIHATKPPAPHRLFDDWNVSMGAQDVRFAIASGSGKTALLFRTRLAYMRAYVEQLIQSYQEVDHLFPEIAGLFMCRREADVGFLLAGQCERWTNRDAFHAESYVMELSGLPSRLAGQSDAIRFLTWPRSESALLLPADSQERGRLFLEILQTLSSVSSLSVLESWLQALLEKNIPLPVGMPPDSPALALIKRILDIDFDRGFSYVQKLFQENTETPFRPKHFQLSLVGALLTQCDSNPLVSWEIKDWATAELQQFRSQLKSDAPIDSATSALIASLLALTLICRDNDPDEAKSFERDLIEWLNTITDSEERRFFLQFVADSVNQYIDKHNIAAHWIKMIVLFNHVKKEESVVWPSSGLVRILRETFLEPASRALNR